MKLKPEIKERIMRRLMPLYIAAFFQSFVLWYSTEKIFMKSIGFTDASIGIMVAVYSGVMLLAETPSGILADRWSRKGVLGLGGVMLMISATIGGLSYSPVTFIVSTMFWGISFALYSGTYDSIIYDTLCEELGSGKLFERFYGRIKTIDSTALVLSSLLGGLIAGISTPRVNYFLTVPFTGLFLFSLLRFREPRLHKLAVSVPIKEHISNTLRAVLKNRNLVTIISVLVLCGVVQYTLFEFDQLWLLALATPVVAYGPINAALLASVGFGASLARRFGIRRRSSLTVVLLVMLSCAVGLIVSRTVIVTVLSFVVICTALVGLTIVFNKLLHDELDSSVRAGAASAVSTMSRMLIIPVALIFGAVSNKNSVFSAAWIILGFVVVLVLLVFATMQKERRAAE